MKKTVFKREWKKKKYRNSSVKEELEATIEGLTMSRLRPENNAWKQKVT